MNYLVENLTCLNALEEKIWKSDQKVVTDEKVTLKILMDEKSWKTWIFTHFPKDRNCEICQRTKITRAPCRRRIGRAVPRSEKFGDLITADHKVLSESCESRNNHRYAIVVHPMDPVVSVQNKNFSGNTKELA